MARQSVFASLKLETLPEGYGSPSKAGGLSQMIPGLAPKGIDGPGGSQCNPTVKGVNREIPENQAQIPPSPEWARPDRWHGRNEDNAPGIPEPKSGSRKLDPMALPRACHDRGTAEPLLPEDRLQGRWQKAVSSDHRRKWRSSFLRLYTPPLEKGGVLSRFWEIRNPHRAFSARRQDPW